MGVDLSAETRQKKCVEILRLVTEAHRVGRTEKNVKLASTFREIELLLSQITHKSTFDWHEVIWGHSNPNIHFTQISQLHFSTFHQIWPTIVTTDFLFNDHKLLSFNQGSDSRSFFGKRRKAKRHIVKNWLKKRSDAKRRPFSYQKVKRRKAILLSFRNFKAMQSDKKRYFQ